MINIAYQKHADFGYVAKTWTYVKLTEHINKSAENKGYTRLSTPTKISIKKILDVSDNKPFRIQHYCEKRASEFDKKMHDVLGVYKRVDMRFDEEGTLNLPMEE